MADGVDGENMNNLPVFQLIPHHPGTTADIETLGSASSSLLHSPGLARSHIFRSVGWCSGWATGRAQLMLVL